MDVTPPPLVDTLIVLLIVLVAVLIESRFGLRKRVQVLWHKLVNSETHFKVRAMYETGLGFDSITDELKSVLRETHGDIDVLEDHKHELVVEVDENFLITLEEQNDTISFETSKMTSTMRAMHGEIGDVLNILDLFEQRNRDQSSSTDDSFTDDTFTAELFLPYSSTFLNVYLPRGVTIKRYELALDYPDYNCTIEDTGTALRVSTDHRDDLDTILTRLLKIWTVWWRRLR